MTGPDGDARRSSGEGACILTAAGIRDLVGGELMGDGAASVSGIAPLDRAEREQLSFLGDARYLAAARATRAGVLLVDPSLADQVTHVPAWIRLENPYEGIIKLLPHFHTPAVRRPGIHPTAQIGRRVTMGEGVSIAAGAVIGDDAVLGARCTIGSYAVVGERACLGDDCTLFPHVVVYPGALLGTRVAVHAGARIGCDGFGYVFSNGRHEKIPHIGGCLVGDDVEIGANATIDRGSIDDTVIGAGTKIDNLVHIGHNVRIGRVCLIMAQVGVAGSTIVEDGVILAGQVGLSGHLTIGAGARLAAQAGVFGDVPAGETWSGYPARPHRESLRASAALLKLAGMIRKLEALVDESSAARASR